MQHLYDFFNGIVQFRAWNYDFYKTIQADVKEYKGKSYNEAFIKLVQPLYCRTAQPIDESPIQKKSKSRM